MEQQQYNELLGLMRQILVAQEAGAKLRELEMENYALKRELEVTQALVAAKTDTITLLRARYDRPN